ncbi:penicillin-binding protein 1C [Colwellia sp. D2M02]|uniref:penicillin-binding protein 1C n=1 Tax=Colwellia sp. D2M02 TaxID=2841562 RepID=UPI001C0A5D42|nr:penicillin-binding protein 1C [Colwellia sp. D2M02]MBU2894257.1 penicillin-binding protein 1C [Colwellia sp. D2M02]
MTTSDNNHKTLKHLKKPRSGWKKYHPKVWLLSLKTHLIFNKKLRLALLFSGFLLLFTTSAIILDYCYPLNLPHAVYHSTAHNRLNDGSAQNQSKQTKKQFARVVVDENDRLLRTFADNNGIWRYPISLSQVSPLYIEALLNYEDRWFWQHYGINPLSLLRASYQNISAGKIISGGSTLSMQVARILHPHARSFTGKFQQVLRTLQLEWHLEKSQILQIYLNTAPFGGTIEGVQAASYTYLNKPASTLTHAEAALLAVLPQAPTRYRPDLHNEAAQRARDKVLQRLADFGVWSQSEIKDAKLEQVYSASFKPQQLAPLLARRLLNQSPTQSVIKSTINTELQQGLQELVNAYMVRLPKKSSAAVLVVDNTTSTVKAYLGTADFANSKRFGYVDMIQATRSPGSTLKPFLYGLALDDGLIHSHSLLADVPRNKGQYRPANFNGAFNGPVSAHSALQRSLNMPAVDLLDRYGVNRFVSQLDNAGLHLSIPDNQPNLAVILGGAGTSLAQLVQQYSALANQGKVHQLRYLQEQLAQPKVTRQLLSPASSWVIQKTLSGIKRPDSINTLAARLSKANSHNTLAWKTGTSYGYRDSWAIGVNKKYTIGVWLGRPDGTAMPGHYGGITAGPLLFKVADQLPNSPQEIIKPDNITAEMICWPLGTKYSEDNKAFCQQKHQAWIIDQVIPPTWHSADSDAWQNGLFNYWLNPNNQRRVSIDCLVNPKERKQVALWPKVLEPWLSKRYQRSTLIPQSDEQCAETLLSSSATLNIVGIENNSIYRRSGKNGEAPSIVLKTVGGSGKKSWYINGEFRYQSENNESINHEFSSAITGGAKVEQGKQQIIVQDQAGNTDMVMITLQ